MHSAPVFEPHIPTLFMVMVAASLVLAAAIAWIGHRAQTERFAWAAGLVCQAMAYTLFALRGQIPDVLSVVLGNVAISSSFAFYTTGLLHFRGIRWPTAWVWGPVAVVAVSFWFLIEHIGLRHVAGMAMVLLQTLLLIGALLYRRAAPLERGEMLIMAGAGVWALLMIVRILAVTSGQLNLLSVTEGGWAQGITFLFAVMSTLLLAIGLIVMSEERAESALRENERLQAYRSQILERMAAGAPLNETLHAMASGIEKLYPDMDCLIALATTETQRPATAFTPIPEGASTHSIVSPGGQVLGWVTVTHKNPASTQAGHTRLIAEAAVLASLAIERSRSEQQRLAAEALMHEQALHDALTQLPNRRLLVNNLNLALAAHRRNGHLGALMFLDLDNFKPLNDQHGHAMGDLLLIEVAHRLRQQVREMDTVARFGGDEFVVLLSDLGADAEAVNAQAQATAQKLSLTLAEPYLLTPAAENEAPGSVTHRCTASIGLLVFNGGTGSAEALIEQADAAMYRAKQAGRNRVHFLESGPTTA
jgi:diguanylate cyclase (GGDEF)-like protein